MKTYQCDVCKRTEPDVYIRYLRRKRWWAWFQFNYDSQDGSFARADVCEHCWDKIQSIILTGFAEVPIKKFVKEEL